MAVYRVDREVTGIGERTVILEEEERRGLILNLMFRVMGIGVVFFG